MTKNSDAALYLRVSRDDEANGESNSIAYQRKLLRKAANGKGFQIVHEYIDDGVSGATFDRPGFNALKQAILHGEIDTILVKDISRLGRDYLMVGHYLERFFPEHDIRFIAVNDNYDSNEGEDDFLPFKNVMNEWYAKDISKKIR